MLRILVAGTTGQIALSLKYRETDKVKIICIGRPQLDLCDAGSIEKTVKQLQPDIVVNAAAYTRVDDAETEFDLAHATNCHGAGLIAKECAKTGIPVVQISTDYVFNGESGEAYKEDDKPEPTTVYGKSKLCGENEVQLANPRHIILRTAWVYSSYSKNFLKTMLRLSTENSEIKVVEDQYGTPSYAGDIADAIVTICQTVTARLDNKSMWGIYHFTNSGETSWYEFASEIMRVRRSMKLPASQITPIPSSMYPTRARRPKSSILDCGKVEMQFGIRPRPWKTALAECMMEADS